jgi:hypothetical protein
MNTFNPLTSAGRKAGLTATLCAVAALATACGSQTGASDGAAKPASSITITVLAAHGATPKRWTLTCDPAGGTHPSPQAACQTLAQAKSPFTPVPRGVMCPMIASGPQTATITGTWQGKHVSATYSRDNGCQTARWQALEKILGQVNPGGPMIPAGNAGS